MKRDPLERSSAPGTAPLARPLRARLQAVAGLVPPGARVVDVGAGPGLLPLWLLRTGRAGACIAVERPRAVGRELARRPGARGLTVRTGDGLCALDEEDRADTLVMSGLGARAMLRVLDQGGEHARRLRRLVLQPQTEAGPLREGLVERGFAIVDERMTRERGRFYTVIAAEPRDEPRPPAHPLLSEAEQLQAGPCLVRSSSSVVRDYWARTLERTNRLVERAGPRGAHPRTLDQRALATRVLAALDACGKNARDT